MINVSKNELVYSLRETMEQNVIAIDYIENEVNRVKDILNYSDNEIIREDLKTLKYIEFSLYFLDKQYMKAFKELGGKI